MCVVFGWSEFLLILYWNHMTSRLSRFFTSTWQFLHHHDMYLLMAKTAISNPYYMCINTRCEFHLKSHGKINVFRKMRAFWFHTDTCSYPWDCEAWTWHTCSCTSFDSRQSSPDHGTISTLSLTISCCIITASFIRLITICIPAFSVLYTIAHLDVT